MGGHGEGLQRPCGDQSEPSVRRGQPQASDGPRLQGWVSLSLLIRTQKKLQPMNGTECRPRAPVAEGGPEPHEGSLGDAPKTMFIFLATPYPLR